MANSINCWFVLDLHGDGISTVSNLELDKHLPLTSWAQSYGPKVEPVNAVIVTRNDGNPVIASLDGNKLRITTPAFTGPKPFLVRLFINV